MENPIIDSVEDKFNKKVELLQKRNEGRLLDLEKDKHDKKQLNADNEKLEYLERTFLEQKNEIESNIKQSHNILKSEMAEHFNKISKDILILQRYIANSTIFLRGYDIKVFQKALLDLTNMAKEYEDNLLPKKKFGFSKKKSKPKGSSDVVDSQQKETVDNYKKLTPITLSDFCNLTQRSNENIELDRKDTFRNDVMLNKLQSCKIKLYGSPSTLHINSLTDCYIFCGPVSTSIFIENCKNCTFIIACQQLRLHKSTNVHIYLHVTSRAIMEDCNNIYFAKYNLKYDNIEEDFIKAGLDRGINNWTCVDDFNWLNAEKSSPNWKVLPEDNLVKSWKSQLF